MSKSLLQDIIDYLLYQKSLGRKSVFRTSIYSVFEYKYRWDADGRMLTVAGLKAAAQAVGGTYVNDNGRARVVF